MTSPVDRHAILVLLPTETRIAIAGGPRTGKTTLAKTFPEALHTDDLMGMGWSQASEYVASHWLTRQGPLVVEGVAVPRALRKWLVANQRGKPVDVVVWMAKPFVALTAGQVSMAKGCETVMAGLRGELAMRGVRLVTI